MLDFYGDNGIATELRVIRPPLVVVDNAGFYGDNGIATELRIIRPPLVVVDNAGFLWS